MGGSHEAHETRRTHGLQRDDVAPSPLAAPSVGALNINLQTDPVKPTAGKPTHLALVVTEQPVGEPLQEFDLVHDRLMHLVIVSDDLAFFDHVHPVLGAGIFRVTYAFPEGGSYKLWADAKPRGGGRCLVAFLLGVSAPPVHRPVPLVPDSVLRKSLLDGKYSVSLAVPENVESGNPAILTFSLADVEDHPLQDLEPLMGAGGHCVIIRHDAREFLHVHPVQEVGPRWRGGPDVTFGTTFPTPGLYKVWAQFSHRGTVLTAAFTLQVR